tara:strand:+ start:1433 stop:1687 length:255 start_codon:yes stop_codon:yes gene_type:complete
MVLFMFYVYILQSKKDSNFLYRGFTTDLQKRFQKHNYGEVKSTKYGKPWKLIFYCAFTEKSTALKFETYLKTPSGLAFSLKRLI